MNATQMAPTRKAKTLDPTKATAKAVEAATADLTHARQQRDAAQQRLTDLLNRIDTGESSSGLGELREQVEIAERIEAAKERALTQVEHEHALAVAEMTARQVAETLGRDGSPTLVSDAEDAAVTAFVAAFSVIPEAIAQRDTTCDAAGERLNAVGVPTGTQIGRIAYGPVRPSSMRGTIPGQWNVRVDGAPYSHRQGHGHSQKESLRLTEQALSKALRIMGMKLNGSISQTH